jgi:hypothetical protein
MTHEDALHRAVTKAQEAHAKLADKVLGYKESLAKALAMVKTLRAQVRKLGGRPEA